MTGKIRIIGGRWRGRKITVPDRPGLRPTGDRVRETLFNWLQADIHGARCLDLFAGSGAIGLEAASRGATRVVLVERDFDLAHRIKEVMAAWPDNQAVEVVQADAIGWLDRCIEQFDLVFIDPPFESGFHDQALERLQARQLLSDRALVYVEQSIESPLPRLDGLEVLRNKCVGRVRMLLLAPASTSAPV